MKRYLRKWVHFLIWHLETLFLSFLPQLGVTLTSLSYGGCTGNLCTRACILKAGILYPTYTRS